MRYQKLSFKPGRVDACTGKRTFRQRNRLCAAGRI
jgi:hypothetical protein